MITILILSSLIISACNTGSPEMKIYYYNNGISTEMSLTEKQANRVMEIVSELLGATDDMLRVYLDKDTIERIKKEESSIEIIYSEKVSVQSGFLGMIELNRVLLPFSGDYAPTDQINVVTVITGEDEYSSAPLTATGKAGLLNELKKLVSVK